MLNRVGSLGSTSVGRSATTSILFPARRRWLVRFSHGGEYAVTYTDDDGVVDEALVHVVHHSGRLPQYYSEHGDAEDTYPSITACALAMPLGLGRDTFVHGGSTGSNPFCSGGPPPAPQPYISSPARSSSPGLCVPSGGGIPCAVHALCEKLAVLHHREFGKFRRLKGRH